jgi:LacI family transcriptional regulator
LKTASRKPTQHITQKALAAHLGLHPSTVSLVLNDAPLAAAIPEETKKRILDAARELDYRPNLYAKYLFSKKSFTVAVLVPSIGEDYTTDVLAGLDTALVEKNYAFFLAIHHGDAKLIHEYPRRLNQRAVEGFILINTPVSEPLGAPTVSIGSQPRMGDMVRILVDNYRGGQLAAEHVLSLGHRQIAVIKGHPWRPASEERWRGIEDTVLRAGLRIDHRLVMQLNDEGNRQLPSTPSEGYQCAKSLLASGVPFTALLAFNDLTALGAMRALHEAGRRVPEDVSVVGFDDAKAAAYSIPGLTTLRQPLREMGALAGEHLLQLIDANLLMSDDITLEPELVVRESTAKL